MPDIFTRYFLRKFFFRSVDFAGGVGVIFVFEIRVLN